MTKTNGKCLKKSQKYHADNAARLQREREEAEREYAVREVVTNYDQIKRQTFTTLPGVTTRVQNGRDET